MVFNAASVLLKITTHRTQSLSMAYVPHSGETLSYRPGKPFLHCEELSSSLRQLPPL